ncbi:MAG: hypothetical protein ACRD43_13355, partial [Pyrinomonadaceae bacterium]
PKVLLAASKIFVKKFELSAPGNFVAQMVARMFEREENDRLLRSAFTELGLGEIPVYFEGWGKEGVIEKREKFFGDLDKDQLATCLFYLTHEHKGSMVSNYWKSQSNIIAIANEFDIDYLLLDAETRIELSPKKHLPVHETYKAELLKGEKAHIPELYGNFNQKDRA